MIWFGIAIGIFLLIVAAMYVPDWVRWARWNADRKRLPERRAKKLRGPGCGSLLVQLCGSCPRGRRWG